MLRDAIIHDDPTPELRQTATQLVMGVGSPTATIVIIGEAPGKREDEQGVPFVGASGKLLDELLASIHLTRDDVYITNIVKYRPPDNRDPRRDEKEAFAPYLSAQLAIIQPKIIITLGRHSMEFFLPQQRIGETHGPPHPQGLDGWQSTLIPLYHPAAALYNGSLRQTLFTDMQMVAEAL